MDIDSKEVSAKDNTDTEPMAHDSMITVRLSEPPVLTLDTTTCPQHIELKNRPTDINTVAVTPLENAQESPKITMMDPNGNEMESSTDSESGDSQPAESRRGSDSSVSDTEGVNWEELEKTEEQEPRNQDSDDSTALLLARLEQENNILATNPKSGTTPQPIEVKRVRTQSRPPSMQQLKKMVNGPQSPALQYSILRPPPMTDLEFYAALVQNYTRTAQGLPTLLSKKIRSGIPPPLRGVVWQSMSGARDQQLEDEFDRLCGETSPYEGIIGKDLGRSFPGVEMFRDPNGDGQQMLGRVLKCFSLYDNKIGYCQGLGFLVGPLLMHMGDKQAFCVLVRLMEHYDMRSCFLPDLSGLHVRIHQFRQLLKQHLPSLSAHLEVLQIEPAYVSQWFLSFFAVTCPLPMLFRIYDVIFAEGASETVMRVAISLMRKNEAKLIACTEFEDAMQLLLSRGLWDCYHYNADEFVNDFVGLTGVVTRENLQALEASYRESQAIDAVIPDVGSAASRFLGRLWSGSASSTKSTNLSPGLSAPSRPVSFLRRSPSKQSLASTLNSMDTGASELSSSTDATSISRDSSNTDGSSIRAPSSIMTKSNKDKDLHSQIEDLLMALSGMQRDHAILATQLQNEREERDEDRTAVKSLLVALRKKTEAGPMGNTGSNDSLETVKQADAPESEDISDTVAEPVDLSNLLDVVEDSFSAPISKHRSSMLQTKSQLRDELARSKEQYVVEVSKTQDLTRRISEQEQRINNLQDEVRDGHAHIRNAHSDKQRLEKQIHDLLMKKPITTPDGSRGHEPNFGTRSSAPANTSGLRELRLGRQNSNSKSTPNPIINRAIPQQFSKRTSSLNTTAPVLTPPSSTGPSPTNSSSTSADENSHETLVLELIQAKTAEAVARQEAEEAKSKLEGLRKMFGMSNGDSPGAVSAAGRKSSPSQASGYLSSITTASAGSFWGGWGRRAVGSGGEKGGA